MKFWDYDSHPYRPVHMADVFTRAGGIEGFMQPEPDVFMDREGKLWFAKGHYLRHSLPTDPDKVERVPRQFWRPEPDLGYVHRPPQGTKRALEIVKTVKPWPPEES